ncbi:MAG: copper homeostasis protein CutC [Anaerolineales bacterium]|nr:copper homeostasis protein CutC [Anaerolineales bacterium]
MIPLEVIAASVDDCIVAEQNGANRIELVSAFEVGGLTPSLGLLINARQATRLPIMAMVRPRAGGFCYTANEYVAMQRDAELLLAHGADGLVFGCLQTDGAIDAARTKWFVDAALGRTAVFHRAFDLTPDPLAALDQLLALGVTRVLTSGQAETALLGAEAIVSFRAYVGAALEVMPGAGITPATVLQVMRRTGADQVHASLSGGRIDPSAARPTSVRIGHTDAGARVRTLDGAQVREVRRLLDDFDAKQLH